MLIKKLKLIGLSVLLFSLSAVAQTNIKGTVISSEDHQPLPGVGIILKGTSKGTITDINGKYSIDVPKNGVLRFTYVGFSTIEETVGKQNLINVTMNPESNQVGEVVVMGYSSQKKAELSSPVVTLSSKNLEDVTTPDIGTMLQGKAAGVMVTSGTGQPGNASEIHIRGTGSITASSEPLYVVDGVPGGTFDPNDVETLTVLKDAGATALYGSAASAGVIVITTKHATRNQPTHVEFKTSIGQQDALFGNFVVMQSPELYFTQKQMMGSSLFAISHPPTLLLDNFNWEKAAFHSAPLQDSYISVSGNTGKIGYFGSFDHYNEGGTLINTNFLRNSARLNLNVQLTDKLTMNIRLAYDNENDQQSSSWETIQDAYMNLPWDNPYDANGNIQKITSAIRPDNGMPWYSQDKTNFLYSEQYNYIKDKSYNYDADFQLDWVILNWLVATSTNRFTQGTYQYNQYVDPRTSDSQYPQGYLQNTINLSNSFQTTNLLKANETFGLHNINGLLGWEYGKNSTVYTSAAGIGMPDGMDALNSCSVYSIAGYTVPGAGWSAFAQAQYTYDQKYFATASFRTDLSSTFGPKKREGYFPSGSASWLINKEKFLAKNKDISMLKLRASYGVTGNSNIGSFQYLSVYSLDSKYQNIVAATPNRLGNPYLSWETAYMADGGLDVGLWNRITLNLDVYNTNNKNLLLNVPVSPSTGFFDITENVGSVRNQGLEIQLNSTNVKTKDFSWVMGFNIAFNQNRVTSTPDDQPFLQSSSSLGISQQVKRGQDMYSWYMPKWLGVDPTNGDPLWEKLEYNSSGQVIGRTSTNVYSQADLQVVGKASPDFTGGWFNSFSYKGFSLNVNTNFVYGNKIYNATRQVMDADGAYLGYNQLSMQYNKLGWTRWEKPGDIATDPKLVMNGNQDSNSPSSRYLENGSYFRVKNVTLSYDFSQKWLHIVKIQSLRIFISADNLYTITRFSGMDPEVSMQTSTSLDQLAGMYYNNYPVSRQYIAGLDVHF
jgi:TonB-linked SusC/RagA family outer membrane protein